MVATSTGTAPGSLAHEEVGAISAPRPGSSGSAGPTYRRRRRWPALVVLALLVAAVAVVWTNVFEQTAPVAVPTTCPAPTTGSAAAPPPGDPAAPPAPGVVVDPGELEAVAPVPPSAVQVRVLNANGQAGQASSVSVDLAGYGFTPDPQEPAANDTVYPAQDMACVGQIRFGPAGVAAARTLSLAVPCAELVQDARPDPAVDLALGTGFTSLTPSAAAVAVLTVLSQPDAQVPPDQLTRAESATC